MSQREGEGTQDTERQSENASRIDRDRQHEGTGQAPISTSTGSGRKLHPLWETYTFADSEQTPFYLSPFSHALSLTFPEATG